jgi:hypothetical protein
MRFLIGFLSGIVAIVAIKQSTATSRPRAAVRPSRPAPRAKYDLARYYRVHLN